MSETNVTQPDVVTSEQPKDLFYKWEPTDKITITGIEFATLNSFVETFGRPLTLLKDTIMSRMKDNNQLKLVDKDGNLHEESPENKEFQPELPLKELAKQAEPVTDNIFDMSNHNVDSSTDGAIL